MTFTPPIMTITAITNAIPAVVTTAQDHELKTGQVVRLLIPVPYGMQELANKILSVSVLTTTTYSLQYTQVPFVDVDSRLFTAFVNVGDSQPAQANCIGEGATPINSPYPYLLKNVAYSLPDNPVLNDSTVEIPF